jgi:thiazole/oxazole-forming peptide maturase SagD family component
MSPEAVTCRENGYRTLDSPTAFRSGLERLRKAGIQVHHQSLTSLSDLGFYGDRFIGADSRPDGTVIRKMQYGKGRTEAQSRASGVFELIERLSAAYSADVKSVEGSHRELAERGYPVVDLLRFPLPSAWNLETDAYFSATVKTRFDHDLSLRWFPAEDLLGGRQVYLPVCWTHGIPPSDFPNHVYHNRPNGLSCGNTRSEALLGGLLELVERDAAAVFALNSLPLPEVALESLADEQATALIERARKAGIRVVVKNMTTDLGIPSFCTLIQDPRPGFPRNSSGMGTHFDKEIAFMRSLTEACLDRMNARLQYENIRDVDPDKAPEHLRWETSIYKDRTFGGSRYLVDYFFRSRSTEDFGDIPTCSFETVDQALTRLLSVLDAAGIRHVFAADLDRYGVPVVKTVAPELEFVANVGYEFRDGRASAERRLYRAPTRMGYEEGKDYVPLSGLNNDLLL